MFSIKQSFANCSQCELLEAESCILETNAKNLDEVDIVFVAENPAKEEVKNEKPLIGKAGQIFRKYFNPIFLKKNVKWLLTNCVLCVTLNNDGTVGNPTKDVIERCKVNCFEIIKQCDPQLIVVLGGSAKEAFGIKGNITRIIGETHEWEGYKVLTTIHPSALNKPIGRGREGEFKESLQKAAKLVGLNMDNDFEINEQSNQSFTNLGNGKQTYKLSNPEFYKSDYMLVDIQYLMNQRKILYVFKDKSDNKYYHYEDDDFICYISDEKNSKKLEPFDNLQAISFPYSKKDSMISFLDSKTTYEADVNICTKHAQDYYLNTEEEPSIDLTCLSTDIETHSKGNKEFPSPEDAKYPVALITNEFKGKYKVFVFDVNNENLKEKVEYDYKDYDVDILVYKSEKQMLLDWIKDVKECDPDVLTGYYVISFDLNYLFNRFSKVGIQKQSISKFHEVYLDPFNEYCHIAGMVVLDLLKLYKEFTQTNLESYSLESVSQKELGRGKTEKGSLFSDIFDNDINSAIYYNLIDVDLVKELNEKLKHIFLQNELRRICGSDFKHSMTPMGRLDSLIVKFMKEKGFACQTADEGSKTKFEGAYVHDPIKGVHDYVVDFDFKSLYPSIILTYNIGVNTFRMKTKDPFLGYELMYNRDSLPQQIDVVEDPILTAKEYKIDKDELLQKIDNGDYIYTSSGCFYDKHENELSFYAEMLDMLLTTRDEYKDQMFRAINSGDKSLENLYDTRQQIYKILANALYGILGNAAFRFFNLDLARTITLSGQEATKQSVAKADEFVDSRIKNHNIQHDIFYMDKNSLFTETKFYDSKYVITGDTDSIFVCFDELLPKNRNNLGYDEIIEKLNNECTYLQDFLNQDIIGKLVSYRNVDPSQNRLKLKNELINKRGIFLSKKHYGIYTIYQEGEEIDKIKDFGLDTKRSDYPSLTKEFLNELLEIILKSKKVSLKKINSYVKQKENEFKDLVLQGDKRTARPVSFGKKLENYKSIPQGVISMLNWNNLMYNAFNTGSKAYMFKLYGLDYSKAPKSVIENYEKHFSRQSRELKVIAIPETEPKLPEFFIPDTKSMLKFGWIDRYNLLLDPIINIRDTRQEF